jgi:DNA-binding IclR family transcriptional regulator
VRIGIARKHSIERRSGQKMNDGGSTKKRRRAVATRDQPTQRGIQSAETACNILKAVASFNGETSLGAISTQLGMLPGNVHRYLASLQRQGFIKQERASGEYDLGPAALALGVRAMRRLDQHDVVFQETLKLSAVIDASVWVAVWTEDSPVVVSVHDRGAIGPLTARLGTQMAAIYSATGRVFLAYRDEAAVERQWKLEYVNESPPRADGNALDLPHFLQTLQRVRDRHGLARVRGDMTKGISAIAAPVFDMWGNVVFVITAVGHSYEIDVGWGGNTATELRKASQLISQKLGLDPARVAHKKQ